MKKLLLVLMLLVPSAAFADSMLITITPFTLYANVTYDDAGKVHNAICRVDGCPAWSFGASWMIDSVTADYVDGSMAIQSTSWFPLFDRFAASANGGDWGYGGMGWMNSDGDTFQMYIRLKQIDLRIPGEYKSDSLMLACALSSVCGRQLYPATSYMERVSEAGARITVTAVEPEIQPLFARAAFVPEPTDVPELPSALLIMLAITGAGLIRLRR